MDVKELAYLPVEFVNSLLACTAEPTFPVSRSTVLEHVLLALQPESLSRWLEATCASTEVERQAALMALEQVRRTSASLHWNHLIDAVCVLKARRAEWLRDGGRDNPFRAA